LRGAPFPNGKDDVAISAGWSGASAPDGWWNWFNLLSPGGRELECEEILSNLVYEDNPWALKGTYWEQEQAWLNRGGSQSFGAMSPYLILIFIAGLIVGMIKIEQFLIVMIITLFIMAVVALALYPTKYQIYDDRIRVVLGWIFHFDIPFSNIQKVTEGTSKDLGVLNLNFINSYSSDYVLHITRKHRIKINITPSNRTLFLENLNNAMKSAGWNLQI
jgi:hypothetical protein